eukprot:COSAG02_NODE_5365_length_4397_cov_2.696603_3_plen_77_part_00
MTNSHFACVCAGVVLNERQRFTYGLDDDQMYIATSGHVDSTTVPLGADATLIYCAQSLRVYSEDKPLTDMGICQMR